MTNAVKKLEEAIIYVEEGCATDGDYHMVIEAAKRDLSRMNSLPVDRKRALDDMPVALNNVLRYEEHNEAVAEWHYKNYSVICSCLSDAGLQGYPMEKAPKDGTVILGYWGKGPGGIATTKYYAESASWVSNDDVEIEYCEPTSWMPLDAISDALGKV